ncbi:MAG TPA: glycine oxidase ThiO [Pirellulales bacterium]|jgi:glycine oxidase|nr:glycine oxidase ThiO [Pirellulales bacterium]
MTDCLIVGTGVVGLSLAYQLADQGARVRCIDAGLPGAEASWAGAGILPPAGSLASGALERLTALSNQLHQKWHERLREETGIDNGFRRSGGVYLARDPSSTAALRQEIDRWQREGVRVEELDGVAGLARIEPTIAPRGTLGIGCYLGDECQLRNPRHLRALLAALARRGVEVTAGLPADDFVTQGRRITAVRTQAGLVHADSFCIAGGAWTSALVARLTTPPVIVPIRGQIVLLAQSSPGLRRIVNEGLRYLVPRGDGRVLVGSTEENVGFDRSTTAGAIQELLEFAFSLVPSLTEARVERSWAGLRPVSPDGRPYLDRVSGYDNAFLAAGHGRAGLQLSPATALVMSRLIAGQEVPIDLEPFRIDRNAPAG